MAARLTDRQKKRIIADYVELGSYNAVAKKYKISATTVKKLVLNDTQCVEKCDAKKDRIHPEYFPKWGSNDTKEHA